MWQTFLLGLSTLLTGAAFAWVTQLEPLASESPAQLAAEQGKPRGVAQAIEPDPQRAAIGGMPAPSAAPSAAPSEADPEIAEARAQAQAPNAAELAAERARRLATEEQDRRRHEAIEKQIAERDLTQARRSVSITMYSTSWCGVCTKARRYMDEKHIPYLERDIDQSPSAKARAYQLNPKGSIPTIDVDGEVMVGFGAENLEDMIDRAAQKRRGS